MNEIKAYMGKQLKELRRIKKITMKQLAGKLNVSVSTVRDWESGRNGIKSDMQKKIIEIYHLPITYFLKTNTENNIIDRIPILGYIRAGLPMIAEKNIQGYIKPPEGIKADFVLIVEGRSMLPIYYPNSLVYIKQQPTVENGEIAVVLIENEEATLKKIKYIDKKIELIPW